MKLGFINGTCYKPEDDSPIIEQWTHVDSMHGDIVDAKCDFKGYCRCLHLCNVCKRTMV